MRALQKHGRRIPDDIAALGWDDIEECAYTATTLSSVVPDKKRIAELAVDHLLDRLGGAPAMDLDITVGRPTAAPGEHGRGNGRA